MGQLISFWVLLTIEPQAVFGGVLELCTTTLSSVARKGEKETQLTSLELMEEGGGEGVP